MKEYKGNSAKRYEQAESKLMLLFPAFDRAIPECLNGLFLDVGCGVGDFSEHVTPKGYKYFGFDASGDMIAIAKNLYPKHDFRVLDATDFAASYKVKFDIILISMVIITMSRKSDLKNLFKQTRSVLKENGLVIIGDTHPAFDPYMQKEIFKDTGVRTKFAGYFRSGRLFINRKKLSGGYFDFYDHHWTISDFVNSISASGLVIETLDECKPKKQDRHIDPKFYDKWKYYPRFMVWICRNKK